MKLLFIDHPSKGLSLLQYVVFNSTDPIASIRHGKTGKPILRCNHHFLGGGRIQ